MTDIHLSEEEIGKELKISSQRGPFWEFPCGPVVKTRHFHSLGLGSIPGQGTKIPQAARRGQKKKKKRKRKENFYTKGTMLSLTLVL